MADEKQAALDKRRAEAQAYLDEMVRKRGYVLDYHRTIVAADPDFAKAANRLAEVAYLEDRLLDKKTKELLFIVSLAALRAPKSHIQSHIRLALKFGLTPEEILEAIEIVMPEAGVVAFQGGLEAWAETCEAEMLDPSPGIQH
jgi:4-carboxymuconolactone decarboxylase